MIGFALSQLWKIITATANGSEWVPLVGLLLVAACVGVMWRAR
jgi:hypothetical protein